MEGWLTIALIAVFATCVIITMDTLEKRADRHEQTTAVVELDLVEEDCSSCHGLGYNDSLLLIPGGGDRRCRDCGGTGALEVWL